MERREFVASAALVLGGMSMAGDSLRRRQGQGALAQAAIPSTGELIPRVGLGTWRVFDVGDDRGRRTELGEALAVLTSAGKCMVDTSPMYGTSEAVLGDLMAAATARERLFVATKVWTSGREQGIGQMQRSMTRLKTDRLDLIQIHNLVDWRTHLRTLREWKDQGVIRYLGITHYQALAHAELMRIMRQERVDFLQLNLSLEEPQAAREMLSFCRDRGVAFIANRPFGGGGAFARVRGKALPSWAAEYDIASWAQFMLKWVLSHEEVTVAIPGTSDPRHMVDNLAAARGRMPDVTARARMEEYWRSL